VVSVGEVDHIPQLVGEVVEQQVTATQRLRRFLFRVRPLAAEGKVDLHGHVLAGHPVRAIVGLALRLNVDLLVIGARGHSPLYERLVGSRAAQILQLAHCPVLAVKSSDRQRRARNRLRAAFTWDITGSPKEGFAQVIEPTG
jgi:nucleotide-binding universal stress UspA family protein